jgi:hypothetical protein
MKAFEAWDAKEYPLPPIIERGPVGRDMLTQRKYAWREALKWFYTKLDYSQEHEQLKALIEEELDDDEIT